MIIPADEELELVWKELGALEESLQNQLELKNQKISGLEARLDALQARMDALESLIACRDDAAATLWQECAG